MKYILLVQSLMIFCFANAQDLSLEFKKMSETLDAYDNYQMVVNYAAGDDAQKDEGKVSVIVDPRGLLYDLSGAKMIINEDHTFLIDDAERSLVYSEQQDVSKMETVNLVDKFLNGIDSLVAQSDSVYFYENNGLRIYNLRFESEYFNLVEVEFKDDMLTEVRYHYNSDFVKEEGLLAVCELEIKGKL